MYRIFMVEDDAKICGVVKRELEKWNYTVGTANDFSRVEGECSEFQPHLVIMDVNLPTFDGFHWCKEIRRTSSVPVLFLSSRDSAMDVVMAVGTGGDDYVTKPFSMDVLLAKVGALLRRAYSYRDAAGETLEHGGALLQYKDSTLHYGGYSVELTRNELKILSLLMSSAGSIVSRDRIMRELWEDESFIDDNTLTVNVNRLRKSLSDIGLTDFIKTAKNQGYEIP